MNPMSSESSWAHVQEILHRILEAPEEQRNERLAEECRGDKALRREVESFLQFEETAKVFLERPIWDLVAGRPGEDRVGETLGPYQLEESIAVGGMGHVYRAQRIDGTFEQHVAVKILKRGFDTRAIVQGFRRERQILAGLEHPGITRLIDGGATSDGLPYLVMEDVRGRQLDEFVELHRPSLEGRLELFVELCTTVQSAHAHLIVHCDLKPSNILINEEGQLKLLDFGIAKILQGNDKATQTSFRRLGTPPYASPEQCRGEPITIGTDIYALGCILFLLIAGRAPEVVLDRHLGAPPLCPSEHLEPRFSGSRRQGTAPNALARLWQRRYRRARLRDELDLIVQKATHLDPERRYSSAAEVGDEVRRFLENRPIRARPDSRLYVVNRFVRRNPVAVASILLLIFTLLISAAILWRQLNQTMLQRDRAVATQELSLELLEVVDPTRGESASEAVRTALGRLQTALPQLPTADRATMLDRMGRMFHRQEFLGDARQLLLRALHLRRHELPWDPRLVAASLNNLALVEKDLGHDLRAIELINEALDVQRAHDIPSEIGWIDQLNSLAVVLEDEAPELAEQIFRQVLVEQQRLHGAMSPEAAIALNNLGQRLVKQGEYDEAIPLLERAVQLNQQLLESDHPEALIPLNNLAILYSALERHESAIAMARRLLDIRRQIFGDPSSATDRSRATLAFLLLQAGDSTNLEEAEGLLRQVLGHSHQEPRLPLVAEGYLARVRLARGHPEEALQRLEELLPRVEQAFSADHWRLADLRSLYGETLVALGKNDEARPWIRDSLPVLIEAKGERSQYVRDARRRLERLDG